MSQVDDDVMLAQSLRTMRIVHGAILGGAIAFLVMALYLRASGFSARIAQTPLLTYIGIGLGVVQIVAHQVVPDLIAASGRRKIAASGTTALQPWYELYQTRMLVGIGLLNGATFFLLVAYIVEGHALAPLAALLFIAGIALQMPGETRVERWVAQQREMASS